jgi:hypothetical protein
MPAVTVKLPFTVAERVPAGLTSQMAPFAQPARVAPVLFRNVNSGFANVRLRLV